MGTKGTACYKTVATINLNASSNGYRAQVKIIMRPESWPTRHFNFYRNPFEINWDAALILEVLRVKAHDEAFSADAKAIHPADAEDLCHMTGLNAPQLNLRDRELCRDKLLIDWTDDSLITDIPNWFTLFIKLRACLS
jgi:hypothetical protein